MSLAEREDLQDILARSGPMFPLVERKFAPREFFRNPLSKMSRKPRCRRGCPGYRPLSSRIGVWRLGSEGGCSDRAASFPARSLNTWLDHHSTGVTLTNTYKSL